MNHRGRLADTPAAAGPGVGYTRRVLVDRAVGSVHQEMVVGELSAGGSVERHLHAFEQALYVLEGSLTLEAAGETHELAADDYAFVNRGVPHSLSGGPARWFEVSAPQPGVGFDDTAYVAADKVVELPELPCRVAHFSESDLPEPSGGIGLAGFGGGNVGAASAKVIVGPDFGATQLNLMVVQYGEGGFIVEHDHAFEEGFLFLTGEIEALLDGERYNLSAGDYCWSGTVSPHGLWNRASAPVRWLETQVPQPPARWQARFFPDWEKLVS